MKRARFSMASARFLSAVLFLGVSVQAGPLSQQLETVQTKMQALQDEMLEGAKDKVKTEAQIKRIKLLKDLQKQERALTEARIQEMEHEIEKLRLKRGEVELRRDSARMKLQSELAELLGSSLELKQTLLLKPDSDHALLSKRMVMSQWVQLRLKDFEGIRTDYEDALSIELKIQEEKTHLEELRESLNEQEALLAFHQKVREDMNSSRISERAKQLEEYHRLRNSQADIEKLLKAFHTRQSESRTSDQKAILRLSPSATWNWPLQGKILSTFGVSKDAESGLQVFHKGIEISAAKSSPVMATLGGTVQFLGRLPVRGNVMILSHAGEFYSLYGQVSEFKKQMGESVAANETIALSDDGGLPLYFEIRSRNLALDPLKWLMRKPF